MHSKSHRRRARAARTSIIMPVAFALVLMAVPALATSVAGHGKQPVAAAPVKKPVPPGKPKPKPKPKPKVDKRPNIVMVLTDDMRADDLRWMPKTKKLIQAHGTDFVNAISPHPLCCPARAEILSGQYAQNNGVRHNGGIHGGYHAMNTNNTVATWLQDSGYQTAFIGKYLNRYRARDGVDPGWTIWRPLVKHNLHFTSYQFYGQRFVANGYVTDAISNQTTAAIRSFSRAKKPFMIMANHVAPHEWQDSKSVRPPIPAKRHRTRYPKSLPTSFSDPSFNEEDLSDKTPELRRKKKVNRAEMVRLHRARIRSLASVDDAVEKIWKTLRAHGQLKNTYIVFTSDNGYSLGEHRMVNKNRIIAENLDVPLIIRGPGVKRGFRSTDPASLVDIGATFADIAKTKPRRVIDGRSLIGKKHLRDTTLVQTGSSRETGGPDSQWNHRGVVTDRYTYAVNQMNPKLRLLYDHAKDPHEMRSVAGEQAYAAVEAELDRRLELLQVCNGQSSCNVKFGPLPAPGPLGNIFSTRR